jgi:hypothetical protein
MGGISLGNDHDSGRPARASLTWAMSSQYRKLLLYNGLAGVIAACSRGPATGSATAYVIPLNAAEAPVVTVRQIVERDTLLSRRVRVTGVCAVAQAGPSAGVWLLQAGLWAVEVRGLVPGSCLTDPVGTEALTIFAQVVQGADSTDRLLLRLPE